MAFKYNLSLPFDMSIDKTREQLQEQINQIQKELESLDEKIKFPIRLYYAYVSEINDALREIRLNEKLHNDKKFITISNKILNIDNEYRKKLQKFTENQ